VLHKRFPDKPTLEYWAIDIMNNYRHTDSSLSTMVAWVKQYIREGVLGKDLLLEMMWTYGEKDQLMPSKYFG
jgi:hypothetical protein